MANHYDEANWDESLREFTAVRLLNTIRPDTGYPPCVRCAGRFQANVWVMQHATYDELIRLRDMTRRVVAPMHILGNAVYWPVNWKKFRRLFRDAALWSSSPRTLIFASTRSDVVQRHNKAKLDVECRIFWDKAVSADFQHLLDDKIFMEGFIQMAFLLACSIERRAKSEGLK